LLAPLAIEAKADDAVEQIIARRDPVEHGLNGLIARMTWNGHQFGFARKLGADHAIAATLKNLCR
jgi:hypothetical protein